MKKAEFLKEVHDELVYIRKTLSNVQRTVLDISTFRHYDPGSCLYGQLFGYSTDIDAKLFYSKSYHQIQSPSQWSRNENSRVAVFSKQSYIKGNKYTALEKYFYMSSDYIHECIYAFVKRETTKITLE